MSKQGPGIEYPKKGEFVSDIVVVNGRLVRPGDVLVEVSAEKEVGELLRSLKAAPYDPGKSSPETDWRQRRGAPPYGDLNRRLEKQQADVRLWSGLTVKDQVDLIEHQKIKGLHYNHVLIGADFYHGGPGGPPSAAAVPVRGTFPEFEGNRTADVAVLDNGMPAGWEKLHAELELAVDRLGLASVPQDPVDEDHNHRLDKQAGHGLFICGLIARVAPALDIQLNRVLHASGEGEEALITATLLELEHSPVKVINMSLGTFLPDQVEPKLAGTIRRLVDGGKVVVASSGNEGCTEYGPAALFPASMREVIAVGAYDSRGEDPELWDKSCRADVYAPGVELLSSFLNWDGPIEWPGESDRTFTGWAAWSGTSFAAPLVAAEIANQLALPHAGSAMDVARTWIDGLALTDWPDKPGTGKAFGYHPTKDVTRWNEAP
jgi:subtilisin family serine protease